MKPTLDPEVRDRFRKRFVIDPVRVFFGDPDELKKQGWEVGKSKLIIKQDITPEDIESFLAQEIERVREEILNNLNGIVFDENDKIHQQKTNREQYEEFENLLQTLTQKEEV